MLIFIQLKVDVAPLFEQFASILVAIAEGSSATDASNGFNGCNGWEEVANF